jgi:glutamyl-Q tRNA(Asp) synthetase
MIVTRFAPSPTGFLHLGHAYAALVACQKAAQGGGRFLLRIEDIDRTRCRREFEQAIFDDLGWLGLSWENPVRRQSEHFHDYAVALAQLERAGLIYPCFCTRKDIAGEIARAGIAPEASELSSDGPVYPGRCRGLTVDQRHERMAGNTPYALRLDVAKARALVGEPIAFEEIGSGPQGQTGAQLAYPERLGDVVLARKDMPTSYHLAVVVDDHLQGVTLVSRGNDLFGATYIQRLLQELLRYAAPTYLHHRLILDVDGRKFSKRNHAVTLASLRASGATPAKVRAMIGLEQL